MDIVAQRPLEDGSRRLQVAELEQDKTENAASHPRFRRPRLGLGLPKEGLSCFTRLAILAAHEACQASARSRRRSAHRRRPPVWRVRWRARRRRPSRRRQSLSTTSLHDHSRCATSEVGSKEPASPTPCCGAARSAFSAIAIALPRWAIASLKAERRSASSPALPHHSIAKSLTPGRSEMTSDRLRFRLSSDERRGRASVQRLTTAFQEAVVGRVLNQRMLETVGRLWRDAIDEEKVCVHETSPKRIWSEASSKSRCRRPVAALRRDVAQKGIGEAPPQHCADLRDFARRSQPVEPRRQRLPQGRRNRLRSPSLAALENQARHLLDE